MTNTKKNRDSNIELLRIVTMLMIMFHHFTVHSGFYFDNSYVMKTRLWLSLLTIGGKLGVNIFVLISGYYLITNKSLKQNFKRIAKFWGQVVFYSIGMAAIYLFVCKGTLSKTEIIYSFLPIASQRWWFVSTYFVMYLLHPYINRLLLSFTKKEYQNYLLFILGLWVLLPSIFRDKYQSNELIWFILLYSIAGYIRLYGLSPKLKLKHYLSASVILTLTAFLLSVVLLFIGTKSEYWAGRVYRFNEMRHPLMLILAICIFMTFVNIKIPYNKFINTVASTIFGVYLIHDTEFFRPIWWQQVLKGSYYKGSYGLIPYSIFAVIGLFAFCSIIDLIRQKTIEKPYLAIIDKFQNYIDNKLLNNK
ncbi:MAG: acyltransferase family protein [Erysipelotrichaceae bacterium]|nr:acyltransferase family protein [Erysipelotrichaceae bacterium]